MGTRQQILLGLMITAGLGFIVDRLFLGEPASAAAESVAKPRPARAAKPSGPSPVEQTKPPADPSLAWLAALPESAPPKRNVFAPSASMKQYLEAAKAAVEAARPGAREGSAEAFELENQLQGTFISRETLLAVVNAKVVRVGSTIDGFRVTRIEPYRVEFRRGRDHASLQIEGPIPPE